MWAARPGRAKADGKARPARRAPRGGELTRDEQRRFDEIARRIDQDEIPIPATAAAVPPRLAAVGLFLVGATGILTGLARGDVVVLGVVGIVPAVVATLVIVRARGRGSDSVPGTRVERVWRWLTGPAGDRGESE